MPDTRQRYALHVKTFDDKGVPALDLVTKFWFYDSDAEAVHELRQDAKNELAMSGMNALRFSIRREDQDEPVTTGTYYRDDLPAKGKSNA